MAPKMPWPRCEWASCPDLAEYWIEVQWTVVDFMTANVCGCHVWDMKEHFYDQTRDGWSADIHAHELDNINGLMYDREASEIWWFYGR